MSSAKTVLIITKNNDTHTRVVTYALSERGHKVLQWNGSHYPNQATVTTIYNQGSITARFHTSQGEFTADHIDVVWNRRRVIPVAPALVVDGDRDFVTEELRAAAMSHDFFFAGAFWINDFVSTNSSELKPLQLMKASKVGLDIPQTLISNDPKDIRDFVSSNQDCIYKPLTGYIWTDNDGVRRMTYTSLVREKDLPRDDLLKVAPGIFQRKVEKQYEVRAQFFGSYCAAVKIQSSELQRGELDWRINQTSIGECDGIELPSDVFCKCRELMRELGLVSGGFDFIVDNNDRWIFLEVNQAGQFLFIEDWCKELHVLEAFCQFVEKADGGFSYRITTDPVRLADVYNQLGYHRP